MTGTPVLVAMSGGVDSSVAAALLQQQGYEVTGVTMKLWGGVQDSGCCSVSDVGGRPSRRRSSSGFAHHVFNFGDEFEEHVVAPYVEAHSEGRTPNPCIECNRHLKFDKLLRRATALGFDLVATGHHARIVERDGSRFIARGADDAKDQSYVLHMLTQEQLAQTLLPLGGMTKDRVRELAAELGLRTADKPDSQDVCFIAHTSGGRERFLSERVELTPGRVVDAAGEEVGRIDAVELVTIGQRKGLGVSGNAEPLFATAVDASTATVTIGPRRDLLTDSSPITDLDWVAGPVAETVDVQVSAHGRTAPATVVGDEVHWADPHRRVAPGQSDRVLRRQPRHRQRHRSLSLGVPDPVFWDGRRVSPCGFRINHDRFQVGSPWLARVGVRDPAHKQSEVGRPVHSDKPEGVIVDYRHHVARLVRHTAAGHHRSKCCGRCSKPVLGEVSYGDLNRVLYCEGLIRYETEVSCHDVARGLQTEQRGLFGEVVAIAQRELRHPYMGVVPVAAGLFYP